VNQHGRFEIAGGEHAGDVREVHADLIAAFAVVGVVRGHFDGAPIGEQAEVVSGLFVGEAHDVVAVLIDGIVVRVGLLRGGKCQRDECGS